MAHTCVKAKMENALENMKNLKTKEKCDIKRVIIAYKRPMNLGKLLSHRDLSTGPLSHHTFMIREKRGACVCVCA